jgi:hypothetical protein
MAEEEANNKILALVLASLNKKDDLKDKLWYLPDNILTRLKSIQEKSSSKSEQIKNDNVEKEKAIKKHVKNTGNYSDMYCIGDDADKNCIKEEEEEDDEEEE